MIFCCFFIRNFMKFRSTMIRFCCSILVIVGVVKASSVITFESIEDLTHTFADEEQIKKFAQYAAVPSLLAKDDGNTHLDAPYHYNAKGWKVDDIPACHFIREGILIDVQDKSRNNPNFVLSADYIKEWEKLNGNVDEGSVVIINFGWAINPSRFHFPRVGKGAAEYLVSKKIAAVGTDTASVDDNDSHAVNKLFAGSNIYTVHNLALNNTKLPPKGFQLIAVPLKLDNAPRAPVRVLALY